jgi:hypothetical protein
LGETRHPAELSQIALIFDSGLPSARGDLLLTDRSC